MNIHVLKLVFTALLLSIGTVLNTFVPGFFFGMEADLLLTTMFLAIALFGDRRNILVIGLTAGLLSALTSQMPGGFLPNIIDKLFTSVIMFGVFTVIRRYFKPGLAVLVLTATGTLLSGTIFLSALTLVAELPGPASFGALFVAVVVPAAIVNTILTAFAYPVLIQIVKRRLQTGMIADTAKRGL